MPWKLDGTRKHPSPGTAADHEVKLRTNFETLRETYGQSNYTFSPTEEVDVQKHERLRKRERLTLAKRTSSRRSFRVPPVGAPPNAPRNIRPIILFMTAFTPRLQNGELNSRSVGTIASSPAD
jgi:hypothetical protein